MVTKVLIMMTIITMVLPLNDDDNNDRDVTSDKCGVFFPLLSHHDGTVRPTILRTYGDDDDSIAVPDNNNKVNALRISPQSMVSHSSQI